MEEIKSQMIKMSFSEYEECLKKGDKESRDKFTLAFIPYLLLVTKGIYDYYQDVFTAFYSYEDFVSDGILQVIELFYDKNFQKENLPKGKTFRMFLNVFRIRMLDSVRNTLSFKMSKSYGERAIKLQKCAYDYKKMYGNYPSIETLSKMTGIGKVAIMRISTMVYVDDSFYYDMEDAIIDSLIKDDPHEELDAAIAKLKPHLRDVLCMLNGYKSDTYSQEELSLKYDITQQAVSYRCNKAYEKIRKSYPYLRDYYAK